MTEAVKGSSYYLLFILYDKYTLKKIVYHMIIYTKIQKL